MVRPLTSSVSCICFYLCFAINIQNQQMDISFIIMWVGFALASYSVVGNDVIQALGTFLTSNEKRVPWYVLWLFAASILSAILIMGYTGNGEWLGGDDVAYDRLDRFVMPEKYEWYFLIPPIALLSITRFGIPVSTTFMILTLFSLSEIPADINALASSIFDADTKLGGMIRKSIFGYLIAFGVAAAIYVSITKIVEKRFLENPLSDSSRSFWVPFQWLSTGFLWSQWLTQDLANIYIYLKAGKDLSAGGFVISLIILLSLLAYIFWIKGGAVQEVVRRKTNTIDIRSASIIDLIYGIILFVFKQNSLGLFEAKLPMSTTWIFIGLLAGRELAIRFMIDGKLQKEEVRDVISDLVKVFLGLIVSIVIVFIVRLLAG